MRDKRKRIEVKRKGKKRRKKTPKWPFQSQSNIYKSVMYFSFYLSFLISIELPVHSLTNKGALEKETSCVHQP